MIHFLNASNEIHVRMGELMVTNDRSAILITLVGSCVALCFYDPVAKVAGMAHVMLPQSTVRLRDEAKMNLTRQGKYADVAIDELLKKMHRKGAQAGKIHSKMVGGASLFHDEQGGYPFSIGDRNVESLRRLLQESRIPLTGEDAGKDYGRWVRFFVNSGEIVVSSKKRGQVVL